jgi:hypothetical protein
MVYPPINILDNFDDAQTKIGAAKGRVKKGSKRVLNSEFGPLKKFSQINN